MNPELEQLKKALQPEAKMNIVDRCRIVVEALSDAGDFPKQQFKLAQYLGVSENLIIKMRLVHVRTIEQLKDWLKTTSYRVDMAYKLSMLGPLEQLKFVNLNEEDKRKFLLKFGEIFHTQQGPEPMKEEEKPTIEPTSLPMEAK